jgi:phosphatidate phosphatase APP1
MKLLAAFTTASRRLLHHLARPAREDSGGEGLVIEPYRGYGNRREIYLVGRVYRQPGGPVRGGALGGDLRASLSRLLRWGVRDRQVTARFAGAEQRVVTDSDGYFRVHLKLAEPPPADRLWHRVELALELPSGEIASAEGEVFVPPARARFVVISDIDDTVMFTGVANKAKMLWRLFAQGAESRVAFPGVAALYRALHGDEQNPILYVSRGPWSIYSMLEAFFQLQRIPVGPVLFLREWGLSLRSPLPRRSKNHKLDLIRDMLALYDELPFVLIGDSGQHDPEIYARIVRENPGRVQAVYIRNVSQDAARVAAIEELANEVVQAGSSLLLASDSVAMAEHAAANGLVPPRTPQDVASERQHIEGASHRQPLRAIRRDTRDQTREAVSRGELEQTLEEDPEQPPNTLVESEQDRRKRRQ